MDAFGVYGSAGDLALLLGLSATRIAVALLLIPLFSAELIPPTVRNAMFLSIALLGLVVQPLVGPAKASAGLWLSMFAKEALIGCATGLLFAGVMWAFESAGQVIDAKIGMMVGQVTDPLTGQQISLHGAFLGRLASYVFMAGGGFMVLVGTLMQTYAAWPVWAPLPALAAGGVRLFESELGRIMGLTLLVAAPAVVVLYLIESVLGLINRFAQQLNVFSLAASLKGFIATWVILIQIVPLVRLLQDDLLARGSTVIRMLHAVFRGG